MNLSQLDGIDALLMEVPRLVGLFDEKEWSFADEVKDWHSRVEMVMLSARIPTVSEVSARRGDILAAETGVRIAAVTLPARATRRKVRDAVALHALSETQSVIRAATDDAREAYAQSRRVLAGLLATASRLGLMEGDVRPPFTTESLTRLWSRIVADDTIGPSASQVLALIGFSDTVVVLRRILTELVNDQRTLMNGSP